MKNEVAVVVPSVWLLWGSSYDSEPLKWPLAQHMGGQGCQSGTLSRAFSHAGQRCTVLVTFEGLYLTGG